MPPRERDATEWLPPPDPLDWTVRCIGEDLFSAVVEGTDVPRRIRITNTGDTRSRGEHWLTVAYSIQRVSGVPLTAWQEVYLAAPVVPQTTAAELAEESQDLAELNVALQRGEEDQDDLDEQVCPECGSAEFDKDEIDAHCPACGYYV